MNRIIIQVEGGIVQAVYADDPQGIRVLVVDFDDESEFDPVLCHEEELLPIPPADSDVMIAVGKRHVRV